MRCPVRGSSNQGALEDDATIERRDGFPELLLKRRLNLWAFGELPAEIDQPPEGSDEIPFVPAVRIAYQSCPIFFAGSPTIGRCQVPHLD